MSGLYPGSVPDKCIVEESGLLKHFVPGDLILADKGFLPDLLPKDVSVNIPLFLKCGKFTESEGRATKSIPRCSIHVARANATFKTFKILSFFPSVLRCHADKLCQLCAPFVNPHFLLIKDGWNDFEFDRLNMWTFNDTMVYSKG